jgi:hypothetical protein
MEVLVERDGHSIREGDKRIKEDRTSESALTEGQEETRVEGRSYRHICCTKMLLTNPSTSSL